MNTKEHKNIGWYGNENIIWIWFRSIVAAILVYLLVLFFGFEDKSTFLVVAAPIILGIFNAFSYFETKEHKHDNEF